MRGVVVVVGCRTKPERRKRKKTCGRMSPAGVEVEERKEWEVIVR